MLTTPRHLIEPPEQAPAFAETQAGMDWIAEGVEHLATDFDDVLEPGADDHPLSAGAVTVEAWQFAEAFQSALLQRIESDNEFPLVQVLLRARRECPETADTCFGRLIYGLADQVARELLERAADEAGKRYAESQEADAASHAEAMQELDDYAA